MTKIETPDQKPIVIDTFFRNDNGSYFVTKIMQGTLNKEVPPAVYSIKRTPDGEYYAEKTSDTVALPKKTFHTGYEDITSRIIQHYESSDKATGSILYGPAGVGKSVTSMMIQHHFISSGKPVYLISAPYIGQDFMDFINDLGDGIFIFDEFEKHYNKERQEKLLSLFDGADSQTKRLSIIIVNSYNNLSKFYKKRTGRMRYNVEWTTLSTQFISEYLDSELENKDFLPDIHDWVNGSSIVTFDNLEAIVKELNTYPNESFTANTKHLNVANIIQYKYCRVTSCTQEMGVGTKTVELSPYVYQEYVRLEDYLDFYVNDDIETAYKYQITERMDKSIIVRDMPYTYTLVECTKEEYDRYMKEDFDDMVNKVGKFARIGPQDKTISSDL